MSKEENIYCKMEDIEQSLLKKASELTMTKFETRGDFISIEELWCVIDELTREVEYQKEKYRELEQDLEDNYEPIPYEEQIGYNPKDFY